MRILRLAANYARKSAGIATSAPAAGFSPRRGHYKGGGLMVERILREIAIHVIAALIAGLLMKLINF